MKIILILVLISFTVSSIMLIGNMVKIQNNNEIIDKTNECISIQLNTYRPACDCISQTIKMMYSAGYNSSTDEYVNILRGREETYRRLCK